MDSCIFNIQQVDKIRVRISDQTREPRSPE